MNKDYLYNVLNLYLNQEKINTTLTIVKGFSYIFIFGIEDETIDVTKVYLDSEEVSIDLLQDIINKYKGDSIVIDDKYKIENERKTCHYESLLSNGRKLIFKYFSLEEANLLRNIIYNISLDNNELRINVDKKEQDIPYNLRLKQAGFSTFITIFLIALWLVDIIVIALWIFKHVS
jgi:hypothetical protein